MDKLLNGVLGFAIGDAMGVPLEFTDRKRLKDKNINKMLKDMSHSVKAGTFSDDTSMVLATMDSISTKGIIDYDDIMNNFLLWLKEGKYTPDDKAFGIGKVTIRAVGNYTRGSKPLESGLDTFMSNGNGSLMRILPIAYYSYYQNLTNEETYNLVKDISSLTHRHEISILGAYIYTLYVINLLNNKTKQEAYKNIQIEDYSKFKKDTVEYYKRILKEDITKLHINEIKSFAFVVDTLEASIYCFLTTENYNESIIKAIHLGNDTDTIGALTGALSGIYYGRETINKEWMKDLRSKELINKITDNYNLTLNEITL